jgi:tol-pal system protein YbgF
MKKSIFFYLLVLLFAFASTVQAGTKEELVRLQEDVNTLRTQFLEFEKTLVESNNGLKSLIEQLNDQVAKSNMLLNKVSDAIEQQDSGNRSGKDEILPEIQLLSGKIDEMITSLSALARQVSEMKVQSKPIYQTAPSGLSSADITFNQAHLDLIEGRSDLALEGFNTYLALSPSGDKATAARYYIGEACYNMKQFPQAIEAFTRVIDENTDSDKVATALYKRGKSEIETQESDKAIQDFKKIIEKFPEAVEAALAKAELQKLGVTNNTRSKKR